MQYSLLTVFTAIADHPNSAVTYVNKTVTLSCEATASGPITYQWRRSNGVITGDRFNGVNTPILTIPSVTQDDEDEYYCTASYGVYVNGTSHVAESERAKVVVFGKSTSRHMVVCHVAKKAGVSHHEYIYRKKENMIFMHT